MSTNSLLRNHDKGVKLPVGGAVDVRNEASFLRPKLVGNWGRKKTEAGT